MFTQNFALLFLYDSKYRPVCFQSIQRATSNSQQRDYLKSVRSPSIFCGLCMTAAALGLFTMYFYTENTYTLKNREEYSLSIFACSRELMTSIDFYMTSVNLLTTGWQYKYTNCGIVL